MAKIVECIPNFSEGRNQAVIDGLVETAKSVPGVTLLDHSSDASHNRSVFTLVGDDQNIQEVAFRLVKYASENIDLTKHQGEHPRMGATDVLPFVPIKDITSEECVEIAKTVSERINHELGIPIFLYEDAATRPERKNLAKVRKGQFEGMPEKLLEPDWAPDYGERKIHPTAGVTAVGCRMPLIAFNINLATTDMDVPKEIAKAIRFSSGGFRFIQAGPAEILDKGFVQVTMNIKDYTKNPIYRIMETVKMEAKRWGVKVTGCEIIGATPYASLTDSLKYYLACDGIKDDVDAMSMEKVVELMVKYLGLTDFDIKKVLEANI